MELGALSRFRSASADPQLASIFEQLPSTMRSANAGIKPSTTTAAVTTTTTDEQSNTKAAKRPLMKKEMAPARRKEKVYNQDFVTQKVGLAVDISKLADGGKELFYYAVLMIAFTISYIVLFLVSWVVKEITWPCLGIIAVSFLALIYSTAPTVYRGSWLAVILIIASAAFSAIAGGYFAYYIIQVYLCSVVLQTSACDPVYSPFQRATSAFIDLVALFIGAQLAINAKLVNDASLSRMDAEVDLVMIMEEERQKRLREEVDSDDD